MLESYKEQMDSLFAQVKTAVEAGLGTENELLRVEASRSDILYQMQKSKKRRGLMSHVTMQNYRARFKYKT